MVSGSISLNVDEESGLPKSMHHENSRAYACFFECDPESKS